MVDTLQWKAGHPWESFQALAVIKVGVMPPASGCPMDLVNLPFLADLGLRTGEIANQESGPVAGA